MENETEIPLFQSLTQPILLGGVPRTFAILNGVLAAVISIPLGLFYVGIPLAISLHAFAAWMTKRDPYFFEVLIRHLRLSHYWN